MSSEMQFTSLSLATNTQFPHWCVVGDELDVHAQVLSAQFTPGLRSRARQISLHLCV